MSEGATARGTTRGELLPGCWSKDQAGNRLSGQRTCLWCMGNSGCERSRAYNGYLHSRAIDSQARKGPFTASHFPCSACFKIFALGPLVSTWITSIFRLWPLARSRGMAYAESPRAAGQHGGLSSD
jgi:hypothetical protein